MKFQEQNSKTIRFEGTYTTTREVLDPLPMLKQRITGIGESKDLNISKFVAIATQNTTTKPPFAVTGTSTYYEDKGDVFYTTFVGTSTPGTDSTLTVKMTHIIKGGTGKFKNASGSFEGKTIADPKKLTASILLKGSITY
jgi:hypothetical protein